MRRMRQVASESGLARELHWRRVVIGIMLGISLGKPRRSVGAKVRSLSIVGVIRTSTRTVGSDRDSGTAASTT